ncbi:Golgi-associated plant pathogenesis-related protein 1-like [Glandiceps talaboti]
MTTLSPENKGPEVPYYDSEGCGSAYKHAPFRCGNMCIKETQFCDGFIQCTDSGAGDEMDCGYGETGKKGCLKPSQVDKLNGDLKALNDQLLEAMNYFRCLHGVNPLVWDIQEEQFSIGVSNSNAAIKRVEHAHDNPFGENLAMQAVLDSTSISGYGFAKMWYDEIQFYDYANPNFASETGHFTQLIWKDSRRVGCSVAETTDRTGNWMEYYVTCEYFPKGNQGDSPDYAQNIPRPIN